MTAGPAAGPLSLLTRLSGRVYVYRPTAAPPPRAPKLILLATWMGAQDSHIAKYLLSYRTMFPSSPILLLRNEPSDFFSPGSSRELATAAQVVRAAFPQINNVRITNGSANGSTNGSAKVHTSSNGIAKSPELLIHVWSNGGSTMVARLRALLRKTASPEEDVLPPYTFVMDSAPGQFHYKATYTAFSLAAPPWIRRLLSPFLHTLCCCFWLLSAWGRLWSSKRVNDGGLEGRGPLERSAESHNNPIWLSSEVRRTYAYSDVDALIPQSDVEKHVAQARNRGFTVRTELFKGTPHVAHARVQPERYWTMAKETWTGEKSEIDTVEAQQTNGQDGVRGESTPVVQAIA